MIRTRRWAAIVGVGLMPTVAGPSAASADTTRRDADGAPGSTIKVGIKPLDPFVTRNGDQYHGFSIDLWNEIARRNSWQTSYVWHDTLPPLLRDVQISTVDVGIAGITITKDREQVLDFSYPMFSAGLEVMTTPRGSSSNWTSELASFVTAGLGRYLLALLAALIIAGHLVWLATRRRTRLGYLAGVGLGIYQAAGLGLVGDYGVADPKRPLGRAAAVMWTIVGVSFVSLFTAALASQLTVRNIESKITGVQYPPRSRLPRCFPFPLPTGVEGAGSQILTARPRVAGAGTPLGSLKRAFSGGGCRSASPELSALSQVRREAVSGCEGEACALAGVRCLTVCLTLDRSGIGRIRGVGC
jgi:hypothetical protein